MKKWISLMLTVLCVMSLLAGCRGNEETQSSPSTALALIISPTANSQGLNFQSATLQQLVNDSISGFGKIIVIVADGNPEVAQTIDFDIPDPVSYTHLDVYKRQRTLCYPFQITAVDFVPCVLLIVHSKRNQIIIIVPTVTVFKSLHDQLTGKVSCIVILAVKCNHWLRCPIRPFAR